MRHNQRFRLQNLVIEEKKNFNQTCRKNFLRSDCTKIHSSITLFQIPVYKKKFCVVYSVVEKRLVYEE